MSIDLSPTLTAALRAEYPGCLTDGAAMGDMVEAILWQWIARVKRSQRTLDEHRPVGADQMTREPAAA